jgi:hypothetical protein
MPDRQTPDKCLVAFSFAGEQREFVRLIAEKVEKVLGRGSVFLDEWFEHYIAGADADLKLQEIYGEQCILAVVCVSKCYGNKPWTLAEYEAIRARQMKSRMSKSKRDKLGILPIRVGDGDVEGILFNGIIPDFSSKPPAKAAALILKRLFLIRPDLRKSDPNAPDWPENPPLLHWPMADHSEARKAFERLLTRTAPWRFLPICGPSQTGKSHISRQMLSNALSVPNLACGRFDFKGTTDMDTELRAFVQELGISLPTSGRLNERLSHILEGLKQRTQPTLLVFDTYEAAGEAEDWVEKQLLPSLIRATWLRVVITGQRVPKSSDVIWETVTCLPIILTPPPAPDWFAYSKRHRSDLTLADVETVCRVVGDNVATLAQLFGPQK